MVVDRALTAADIRAYRDVGVTGARCGGPGPDPKSVLSLMREFAEKVQHAAGQQAANHWRDSRAERFRTCSKLGDCGLTAATRAPGDPKVA